MAATVLAAGLLLPLSPLFAGVAQEQWHVLGTEHFTILTDADPDRAGEIGLNLELFRAVFARLAPEVELKSPVPTKIFAFRNAESYAPFKSVSDGNGVKILGQFVIRRDGNVITLDASSRQRDALAVVFHEYAHYLVRNNFPQAPLWFQEGLAEYYSTFWSDGESAVLGLPVQRHVDWLRRAVELGLDQVLETRRQEAKYLQAGSVGRFYAVSWALAHYLLSGNEERLGQVAEYLILLQEGAEPSDALTEVLGLGTNRLEGRLAEYVAAGAFPSAAVPLARLPVSSSVRMRPLSPAESLFYSGELQLQLSRTGEAERHFRHALDLEPDGADALAGLAAVRDLQSRLEEADELFEEAVALGSSYPPTFFRWGRHHLARLEAAADAGNEAGVRHSAALARDAFSRAVELDPGFAEARALLGVAHLYGEVDPLRGVSYLEQAIESLPSRADLIFHLVRLLLRAGDLDRAQRVVETDLARRGEPELLWRARQDVQRAALLREAETALQQGEWERAIALLDQAISQTDDERLRAKLEERLRLLQTRQIRP